MLAGPCRRRLDQQDSESEPSLPSQLLQTLTKESSCSIHVLLATRTSKQNSFLCFFVDNRMSPIQFTKTFNVEIRSHAKLRHGGHSRGLALDFGLIRIGVTFQTPSNQNRSRCIMFNMERLTLPLGNPHQTIREAVIIQQRRAGDRHRSLMPIDANRVILTSYICSRSPMA